MNITTILHVLLGASLTGIVVSVLDVVVLKKQLPSFLRHIFFILFAMSLGAIGYTYFGGTIPSIPSIPSVPLDELKGMDISGIVSNVLFGLFVISIAGILASIGDVLFLKHEMPPKVRHFFSTLFVLDVIAIVVHDIWKLL